MENLSKLQQGSEQEEIAWNEFMVGTRGDGIAILLSIPRTLSKERALRLAAWIAAIADPVGDDFERVREAVLKT